MVLLAKNYTHAFEFVKVISNVAGPFSRTTLCVRVSEQNLVTRTECMCI